MTHRKPHLLLLILFVMTMLLSTAMVHAAESKEATTYVHRGCIISSISQKGISGATIVVRKGRGVTTGTIYKSVKTDASGNYKLSLPSGSYTFGIRKTNFVTRHVNVTVSKTIPSCSSNKCQLKPAAYYDLSNWLGKTIPDLMKRFPDGRYLGIVAEWRNYYVGPKNQVCFGYETPVSHEKVCSVTLSSQYYSYNMFGIAPGIAASKVKTLAAAKGLKYIGYSKGQYSFNGKTYSLYGINYRSQLFVTISSGIVKKVVYQFDLG